MTDINLLEYAIPPAASVAARCPKCTIPIGTKVEGCHSRVEPELEVLELWLKSNSCRGEGSHRPNSSKLW